MSTAKTMFDKIWEMHEITKRAEGESLLYVDYNLVHEGAFYAFDALELEGRSVLRTTKNFAFADHYVPTTERSRGTGCIADPEARIMVEQLERNAQRAGIIHFGMADPLQGIMHVVAPEIGLIHPGMVISGSDSHIVTDGAFGALAFGVGASQVKHIFATQTVWLQRPKLMRITVNDRLRHGVTAKDLALAIINKIGIASGTGHAIEYAGSAITSLTMEGRMTLCNMSIESGARTGMIAPDETTFNYLKERQYAPSIKWWNDALKIWRRLPSDDDAVFDCEEYIDGSQVEPMVTWGTYQDEASPVSGKVPNPESFSDPARKSRANKSLSYMKLAPDMAIKDIKVDRVFIGSCTNARLEDLKEAAHVVKGRKVVVPSIVVPGSMTVKRLAEADGLHEIFRSSGFEWREPGCSMCTGSNGDRVPAGERCASTSNRNFEGRQGRGSLTHLVSPATAAAAAVTGRLVDVRDFI